MSPQPYLVMAAEMHFLPTGPSLYSCTVVKASELELHWSCDTFQYEEHQGNNIMYYIPNLTRYHEQY